MNSSGREATVENLLTHLNAAYTLARWLLVDQREAEDVVVAAYTQAVRYEARYSAAGVLARLLMLVRNECHARQLSDGSKPEPHGADGETAGHATQSADAGQDARAALLRGALLRLPLELREVIVLREVHQLPYKDISTVIGVPTHTVMSRLSRVRAMLLDSALPEAVRAAPLALSQLEGET